VEEFPDFSSSRHKTHQERL